MRLSCSSTQSIAFAVLLNSVCRSRPATRLGASRTMDSDVRRDTLFRHPQSRRRSGSASKVVVHSGKSRSRSSDVWAATSTAQGRR